MKNPAAFPHADYPNVMGMTLRDYFAAKALQGLITGKNYHIKKEAVIEAYAFADAMLKARGEQS